MGSISTRFADAFRDYVTNGVPGSGEHEPIKSEIRAIGPAIESALSAINLGSVDVIKTERAALNADLAHPADTLGLVYADAVDANNDIYVKTGAPGAGGWTLTTILHDTASSLIAPYLDELAEALTIVEPYAGQPTAKVAETAGDPVYPAIFQNRDYVNGRTYVFEVTVKGAAGRKLQIYAAGSGLIGYDAVFDLETGLPVSIGGSGISGVNFAEMKDVGGGYYQCRVEAVAPATNDTNVQVGIWRAVQPPYDGNPASFLSIARIREWENGVLVLDSDAAEIASPAWSNQNTTRVVDDAVRYRGVLDLTAAADASVRNPTGAGAVKPLSSMRLTTFGSSITLRNPGDPTWATQLAAMSGIRLTNLGISGGSLALLTGGFAGLDGSGAIYDELLELLPNAHAVGLECGPNDFYGCATLGTLNGIDFAAPHNNDFYNALSAAIIRINLRAPNARIFMLTPYGSGKDRADAPGGVDYTLIEYSTRYTNANGNRLWQFQKAIEDVAELYGVRLVDVGRKGGVGWFTTGLYTTDRLHTNLAGANKNGRYVYADMLDAHAGGYFDSRMLGE